MYFWDKDLRRLIGNTSKWIILGYAVAASGLLSAQEVKENTRTLRLPVQDSLQIDSVSLNPRYFKVLALDGTPVDSTNYVVDYSRSIIYFNPSAKKLDSVQLTYLVFPEFLTRTYKALDEELIVPTATNSSTIYALEQRTQKPTTLFEGLNATGSITRGITVGNNQNAVLTSQLDLQLSGMLSEKVGLRASIKDANIPLQENGYSQRLDEFDQVFIELFSNSWNIRAGDVNLYNAESYFLSFSKKIQGLSLSADLKGSQVTTKIQAAGALARGRFAQSRFQGQEGNQGPYKLLGNNQELYILIISGSERVYVNGLPLQQGENKDYTIDYNAGEITFNPTFPIATDMRITVDYQYTENQYTRFLVYGGTQLSGKKWRLGTYLYSESDAKNQPIQQNLTSEQVAILQQAGDNRNLMVAPSAVEDSYSENKILYRKESIDGEEVFVYSNNPEEELFTVRFTLVGPGNGDYVQSDLLANGYVYEYIAPINNSSQGNYAPVVQLYAPTKIQLAILNGGLQPSEKTDISFEGAYSINDLNLYSDKDKEDDKGYAARLALAQNILKKKWKLDLVGSYDFINSEFRNLEGIYQIEFNRDWNLPNQQENVRENLNGELGDQNYIRSGIIVSRDSLAAANYRFEVLNYSDGYHGSRHLLEALIGKERWKLISRNSALNSSTETSESHFYRSYSSAFYSFKSIWTRAGLSWEDAQEKDKINNSLSAISQRQFSYMGSIGIGDSTKIFANMGYRFRSNDSLRLTALKTVNKAHTYFAEVQPLKNQNSQLRLFASLRDLQELDSEDQNQLTLNTRLNYSQHIWNHLVQYNLNFESNAGSVARQDFVYVKVDPGRGVYVWVDYNSNGIQELEEFEVAPFPDVAEYIRVLLPNRVFVPVYESRIGQNITLNPASWIQGEGIRKFLSHFYNQTSLLLDQRTERTESEWFVNPLNRDSDRLVSLAQSLRTTLFFNRGKQHYSTSYTYLDNSNKNLLAAGSLENSLQSHQFLFIHKMKAIWLFNLQTSFSVNESSSENFISRNYKLEATDLRPKVAYLFNSNNRIDLFYIFQNKQNLIGNEALKQNRLGISITLANKENSTITAEFNYVNNAFEGSSFTPAGYQMLEGLQPGTNYTWNLLSQYRITKFLNLDVNYQGRSSENTKTIHTGSIQLRAFF